MAEGFRDGVWFVPLGVLSDPELVLPTIAHRLGLKEPQSIQQHLGEQQLLIVLDNFEQLLDAAPSVAALLRDAPSSKLLVTSRASLHLSGEQEYPVPPLADEGATRLFIERARAARPSFAPDEHVREICVRLDNLPLALELAAARVKVLFPEELLARLEQRLPLLTGGARDLPERQRTLRATIDWSYKLLTPEEQELFVRLAVFSGGCTLQAAEEVAEADLDALQSLVEQSLLRESGTDRFSMLATVHEYALERFAEDVDREKLARRHAEYLLRLGEKADEVSGEERQGWIARLRPELGNLRAAFAWALANDPEVALRLGSVSGYFRPPLPEWRRLLEDALACASDGSALAHARVQQAAAQAAILSGDAARAGSLYEQSLTIFRTLNDEDRVARALFGLGMVTRVLGDPARAKSLYEESLAVCRRLGNTVVEADTLNHLGDLECELGNFARAEGLFERSIDPARAGGDPEDVVRPLHGRGDLALVQGEATRAVEYYREALVLALKLPAGERIVISCLGGFAGVAAHRGEHRTGRTRLGCGRSTGGTIR